MFRLQPEFLEELKKTYRSRPVISNSNNRALAFSVPRLSLSIGNFIDTDLHALDKDLYNIYAFKSQLSYRGYKKDNLYRLFQNANPQWNPSRDLIDLLCYYTFGTSYQKSIEEKRIANNLTNFYLLKTQRDISPERKSYSFSDKIEDKLLNYQKKRIDLAIDYSDDLDLMLESFDLNDLEILKQLKPLRESLGEIHWDYIVHRLKLNKNLVRGLKVVTPIDKILVGFFILYPLTMECDRLIKSGIIIQSDQFEIEHLCENFKSAYSVYISLVFAVDRYSRAFVLLKLKDELLSILLNHSNLHTIYVRPTTDDGIRNVERNNFHKLEVAPSIYYKTRAELIKDIEIRKQLQALY